MCVFCGGSCYVFTLAGLSDKLDFLDEEQTSSQGNKKGSASQRMKKGWDQIRKIFKSRISDFFFQSFRGSVWGMTKPFWLMLVKISPRSFLALERRKTVARMEQRLKCANFCLFNKKEKVYDGWWESIGRYLCLLQSFLRKGIQAVMLFICFSDQMPKDDTRIRSLVLVGRRRAQSGTQRRVLMTYPASDQK